LVGTWGPARVNPAHKMMWVVVNLGGNKYTFNSSGTCKNLEMSLKAITLESV